ncbi:MAG: heparinase II/III family protein [Clostridia bacterium]|nr:heparinase II/III family protein [Clostridia bacterium]
MNRLQLLGKAQDPSFWTRVREGEIYRRLREELLTRWEAEGKGDIPALNYSAYRRFVYDGDRDTYEKPYFKRRRAMNVAAVLALIYPEREEYLVQLMDLIYAVCDEYTWCLPAHQTELGVNNNRHIDLFAAETGFCLSEIYTLLGDRLEPLIADRIRVEVDRRIIRSYLETRFFWEKNGSNWAAVCTGSVSCTFMLMRPDLMPELEERFCTAMNYFLGGFGPDGVCEEGFAYWCYGFGFFTVWADMIRTFTEGRVDWFKLDQVKAVAPFLSRMYLTEACTVSFSDAGRTGRYNIGVLHYLKHEYPDDVVIPDPAYSELMDGCGRWCTFLRTFTWMREEYLTSEDNAKGEMIYYAPSVHWLVRRSSAYSFAAKGGHNCEPHNHHDVGSFILAKDGRQILTDPGSGVYTRQYFSGPRYTYVSCGSHGHSVPYFGTDEDRAKRGFFYGYQKDGRQFGAKDVSFTGNILTMDIAPAYGEPAVHKVMRTFTLGEHGFTLRDEFDVEAGLPITERLVSLSSYTLEEGRAVTDGVTLTFDPALCDPSVSLGDFRPDTPVYFLDLRLREGVTALEITVHVE